MAQVRQLAPALYSAHFVVAKVQDNELWTLTAANQHSHQTLVTEKRLLQLHITITPCLIIKQGCGCVSLYKYIFMLPSLLLGMVDVPAVGSASSSAASLAAESNVSIVAGSENKNSKYKIYEIFT